MLSSFYPLMAFTFFMAYIHSSSEMSRWRKDKDKNSRTVAVLHTNPDGGFTTTLTKRGDLRPGDIIRVGVNEELPADMIITGIQFPHETGTKKKGRIHWAMNEVQVTGTVLFKYISLTFYN